MSYNCIFCGKPLPPKRVVSAESLDSCAKCDKIAKDQRLEDEIFESMTKGEY